MASIVLIHLRTAVSQSESMRSGNIFPTQDSPYGYIWSYLDTLIVFDNSLPPEIDFHFGTAQGKATKTGDRGRLYISAQGTNPADVERVVSELKKAVGCRSLSPVPSLPNNIKGRWPKIKFLWSEVKSFWNWFNRNN